MPRVDRLKITATLFAIFNIVILPIAAAQDAPPGTQWALLVGIEKYLHAEYACHAENDAIDLGRALISQLQYRGENVKVLVSGDGPILTPDAINRGADELLSRVGPNDTVLILLSGHGLVVNENAYIATASITQSELDREDTATSMVSLSALLQRMRERPAKSRILLLDACHSGAAKDGAAKNGLGLRKRYDGMRRSLEASTSGVVTIASCEKSQTSTWDDSSRHGLFTHWILQGLMGDADGNDDSAISATELFEYIAPQVDRQCQSLRKRRQTPFMLFEGTQVVQVGRLAPGVRAKRDRLKDGGKRVLVHVAAASGTSAEAGQIATSATLSAIQSRFSHLTCETLPAEMSAQDKQRFETACRDSDFATIGQMAKDKGFGRVVAGSVQLDWRGDVRPYNIRRASFGCAMQATVLRWDGTTFKSNPLARQSDTANVAPSGSRQSQECAAISLRNEQFVSTLIKEATPYLSN